MTGIVQIKNEELSDLVRKKGYNPDACPNEVFIQAKRALNGLHIKRSRRLRIEVTAALIPDTLVWINGNCYPIIRVTSEGYITVKGLKGIQSPKNVCLTKEGEPLIK